MKIHLPKFSTLNQKLRAQKPRILATNAIGVLLLLAGAGTLAFSLTAKTSHSSKQYVAQPTSKTVKAQEQKAAEPVATPQTTTPSATTVKPTATPTPTKPKYPVVTTEDIRKHSTGSGQPAPTIRALVFSATSFTINRSIDPNPSITISSADGGLMSVPSNPWNAPSPLGPAMDTSNVGADKRTSWPMLLHASTVTPGTYIVQVSAYASTANESIFYTGTLSVTVY